MTKRGLLLWVLAALITTSAMPSWAAPATPPKAGNITALLPVAKIIRGSGKTAVTTDAKKGDPLVWNDLVKTEKGGRARITLADQSILSLGSQAELRILKHDAKSQQTALEMAYGRVRAQVANITRDGGSFELRTPTAVAGVIGTDFGVDSSSVGGDTFVCLAGAVQVSNSNRSVPGSVQCTAGQTTTVQPGKPPTPPQPASPQQIQQIIELTEPAIIASISPAAALPGTTFDTTVAGQNMAAVTTVGVSGSGVAATLKSASANGVQIHVVVAQSAAPGARTITLSKQAGASSATVFTVLGPPSGDLKAGYLQTLQQLTQTGVSGLGGFTSGAQQSADQIAQAVTNANLNLPKPIDLSNFANALNQQYGTVQTALQSQDGSIAAASTAAATQFQTAYEAAYQALLQRNPAGTPDSTFNTAVTTAFQNASTSLQTVIGASQTTLNGSVQTYSSSITQLQTDWIQNINAAALAESPGPTPKVNAFERDVELGGTASFDASGSTGTNGATIASTSWALCGPSYQPAGFGSPLPAGATACNSISGFASTQSEFDIATCSLSPGTYFARLTLTDSNGKVTPMDVKLLILQPNYGTPTQTIQNLASAYSSLQYSPFASFFDSNAPGISTYLNNVQNTLTTLNSMSINLISSQDTVTCNEAVTRANWQQNFTFIGSPNSLLTASEQLTVYMHRSPGTGWLITNLVGDNGRIQGSLPGPLLTNAALPDLIVAGASLGMGSLSAGSSSPINPGQVSASAQISNTGNGDLTSMVPVVFSLLDASNNVLATSTQNLPGVAQGATVTVSTTLNVPTGTNGTKLTLQVNVNPGCSLQEKSCDAKNQQAFPLVLQNNVVALSNVTAAVTVSPGGATGVISLDVTSTIFPVQVCSTTATGITLNGQSGNVCSTATAAGPVSFAVAATPQAVTGIQNLTFTASNAGNTSSGVPPAMTTTMVPVTVALPDLQFGTVVGLPTPLQAGATASFSVPVKNGGNADAIAGWNLVFTINSQQVGSAIGPAIPAGQTVNVTLNYTVPLAGTPPVSQGNVPASLLLNANGVVTESNTTNNAIPAVVTIADFALTTVASSPAQAIAGRSFSVTAVSLAPSPYPFPVNVAYAGLPAGLAAAGNSNNLVGGVVSGTPSTTGNSTVSISGTSSGVTHAASSSIVIQTGAEIAYANVTPSLGLLSGGASGTVTMDISGGVYPVTVCSTGLSGVTVTQSNGGIKPNGGPTTPGCRTLTAPGTIGFSVAASSSATLGAQNLVFTAADAGVPASGVPAGNVSVNVPITVNGAPDLQIGSLVGIPATLQMGSVSPVSIPVTNAGNGSAAAGYNVVITINGTQAGTATGPAISAGQTVNVPVTITAPIVGTPPQNLSNITVVVTVNSNGAVTESNTANDTATTGVGLVDFALTPVPTGPVSAIAGRPFSITAVSLAPAGDPLPVSVAYTGLPSALAASGASGSLTGGTISGTPAAAGTSIVSASGTSSGVPHAASGSITIQTGAEIVYANVTQNLALLSAGPSGNVSMDVSGGVYPVMVCSAAPTGVTITAPLCRTLTGPGSLTFTVSASSAATLGAQNLTFTATDPGIPASGVPAGNVIVTAPISVNGAPDLQIGTLTFPAVLQMGSTTGSTTVPVTNSGNGPAAAGYNVVVTINGTQAGTAIGPAIPAGQAVNVTVPFTVPTVGTPPQSLSNIAVVVTVNSNGVVTESNPNNDSATASTALYDFSLAILPTGSQTGVVGRALAVTALSVSPVGYPGQLSLSENYVGLPAGLTGSGVSITGTPTNAGPATVTILGVASGVSHNASSTLSMNILSEITPVESTVPALVAGDAAQNLTLAVTGGVYPVTLSIALPTGITSTVNLSQTLTGPGNVIWDLKADFTATTGTNLPVIVHATDAGVPATSTSAGNVNFTATYNVNANANYVVTSASWQGHTAPYTAAEALQVGESTALLVTVQNTGNGSPTGMITVTADCGVPTACSTPLTGSMAAPAAGASATLTLNSNTITLPVATYHGTATITTNISGAVVGPPGTLTWDVVDFAFNPITMPPAQNCLIGGSCTVALSLAVQVPQGSPFGIPIVPSSDPNLTFTPASQTTAGANIPFTVNVGAATPATASANNPDMITFTATNHGVAKTAVVPVNYFSAQMVPQNIFVNDAANPLSVPVEVSTQPNFNDRYPDLSLKMTGNYVGGTASLTVTNPSCGSFSDNPSPTIVSPADLIDFPIYANPSTNCPASSIVTIKAAIPNTNPALTIPVYTLYVTPKGLAQLQVMSMTPARDLTSQPWLAGEPMDWTVVVKNVGSGPSTGNEQVMLTLNSAEIGKANVTGTIAANATIPVTVHTDAPDVAQDVAWGPTAFLVGHIMLDSQGDLEPGTGDNSAYVNVSNWSIGVSGNGSSDGSPVTLDLNNGVTSSNASVIVNALQSGTFNPNLTLPLVLGTYSSGQLNPSNLSPTTVSSGAGSTVTVSVKNGQNPLPGSYYVQVISQMKDGGNVTTQRQATIHVNVVNFSTGTPANITLASDQNNIGPCSEGQCSTPNGTVQVNGPLPSAFNLSASVSFCSGGPCTGNIDISFTDTYMTNTTPQVSTIGVTSPGNTLPIRVSANTNPDGTINTGGATVIASVSAIQAPFASVRQPTPDPVGNNQYGMTFNIGDIYVSAPSCVAVQPQATSATAVSLSYIVYSGFNVPSLAWEWEDSNHLPVGGSPLSFGAANGTSSYSNGSYSALPTFNLNNSSTGVDGLQTYYFAVTVSNGLATATKYFPVQFDLSQGQTFCATPDARRGTHANVGQMIRGAWGRNNAIAKSSGGLRSGKLPDVRIAATDISYTPSMPKTGDTVSVRFKISNVGDVNATAVPVALQVNGNIVAQDTFDVAAGKTTLGALQWNNAQLVAAAATPASAVASTGRASRLSRMSRSAIVAPEASTAASPLTRLNAMVVIDPRQTMPQKTAVAKQAPLAHFSLHDALSASSSGTPMTRQRAVLELAEGGCAGLRFNMGAGGCSGSADVTITVEDLAKGAYKIEAANGIADLGMGRLLSPNPNQSFSMTVLAQSGHTYAVQLRGGQVGTLTMSAVRNPNQLSEAAQKVFRGGPVAKVVSKLGASTAAPETQTATESKVYFDIMYQGQ